VFESKKDQDQIMNATKIVKINPLKISEDYIRQASEVLKQGGLVVIPTETVYGIAADSLNELALVRLREIKKRSLDKPFSLAIDNKDKVDGLARDITLTAYKLMDKFWPGPLTLILKGIKQPTIGLRMPGDEIALKVISQLGNPVALPSANLAGEPAPENFEVAIKDLNGLVDFAIDAGGLKIGVESTIVDLSAGIPQIVRLGAISNEEINKAVAKKNILFVCTGNTCRSVMAEALFKKMMREQNRNDVEVSSAGVMALAGLGASQGAKEVLAKERIDVSGHVAHEMSRFDALKSDLILVMERKHEEAVLKLAPEVKNRVFLLREFAKIGGNNLDIVDPIMGSSGAYEETFNSIKEALERVSKII